MAVCCFIGHRELEITEKLEQRIYEQVEKLICDEEVNTFLFGSKSLFNSLCYEQVTKLKQQYPDIKRIYLRAEFPDITDDYQRYLLERYEDTYYAPAVAGRMVYVERNRKMIDKSDICIMYYREQTGRVSKKSGTKIALEYARKRKKKIILFP